MAEIEHLKKAAETLAATHMDIRTREPADDIGWFAREMVAVLKELETVRAERDALRAALNHVLEIAYNGRGFTTITAKNAAFGAIKDVIGLATAALNTQPPQAEWTPRIDDKVRTAWSGAICTVVNTRDNRSLIVSESGIEGWINNSDLAPVDESEV